MDIARYQQLAELLFDSIVTLEYLPSGDDADPVASLPSVPPLHGSFLFNLQDCFDVSLGRLRVTVSDCADETQSLEFVRRVQKFVDWAVEAIVADIEQEREMDGMAVDLGSSYEELNLVYALDELANTSIDAAEGNVFEHLSNMCLQYLGVDDAFFLVRDFTRVRNDAPSNTYKLENPFYDREALAGLIFDQLKRDNCTVVCNSERDLCWHKVAQHQGVRIIGTPVHDMDQNVSGVFVVVNSLEKPEYTNGDKKIVEVLASHASATLIGFQDELTGLYNQNGFEVVLNNRMSEVNPGSDSHSLVFLEVDNFTTISDSLGVAGSSKFTRFVAHLLKTCLGEKVLLGRIDKSEFVVKLKSADLRELSERIVELQEHIAASRFHTGKKMIDATISAGVAELASVRGEFSHLLGAARIACSVAMEQGKSQLYIPKKLDPAIIGYKERVDYLQEVTEAVEQNRLRLFLQPIVEVSVGCGDIFRYEILLRVEDKYGKICPPARLISVAEEFSVMQQIDRWVVHHALSALEACADKTVRFAINLSGQSLNNEFSQYLEAELNSFEIEPARICFEITETAVVSNLNAAVNLIKKLRARGCRTSLDDFGSGLSSFSYLQTMPVDYLKIDGSIVKDIVENPVSRAMVDAINRVGLAMRICTVAEYVEDERVLEAIKQIGVHYGQGWGLGKPRSMEEVLAERDQQYQTIQTKVG